MPVQTRFKDEWLVRLLVSQGTLDPAGAESLHQAESPYASQELLRRGLITKERLARGVQSHYGIAFADPESDALDKVAIALVPERLCQQHTLFPLKAEGDDIKILMANPIDSEAVDSVMALSGRRPVPLLGLPEKIAELIVAGYGSEAVIFDLLKKLPDEAPVECLGFDEGLEPVDGSAVGAPVIRLANLIISQAVRLKTSDIHIEQEEKATTVRYRIDGNLRAMLTLPKSIGEGPLVSRIKIMANMDVAVRRRPQDGRAKVRVGAQEVGLRVSTIPTSFGEKAVLRILDKRQAELPLAELGFRPQILERLTALSQSNQGMFLITGPTGSGKTTTLYSVLHQIKSEGINVVTVEDPIEYRIDGINQVQVNEKAGMTFAAVLRSVLRQDPDVVLLGEIRDRETADIAFQAALTGHLVFSTLHTNDAVSAISRLLDMGVERFKMAPALIGVASQRLVRRICPACRVEERLSEAAAEQLSRAGLPARQFKGRGCEQCAFTGLKGRTTLTELLDLSGVEARDLLGASHPAFSLRDEALKRGWLRSMAEDALWHVSQGEVAFDEAAAYLDGQAVPVIRASGAPAPARRRVLIIDDNSDNRTLVRDTIAAAGYDVAEADGGARALEMIAREKPDLLLLDLMMPEVDGFAVLRKLRGEMGLADLPVFVLTAMSEAESQALALELGADDYMAKPFDPRVLRARVKARFRRSEYPAA